MAVGSSMQATAEEAALQEQVTKALESQGVLGQIKAQLRAAVFQAIHGRTGDSSPSPRPSQASLTACNALLKALGDDGRAALELVRNLLECLQLDHTLTVFLAEAYLESEAETASKWRSPALLCEYVGVDREDEQIPVLVKMVQRRAREPVEQPEIRTFATSSVVRETLKTTTVEREILPLKQDIHRESSLPSATREELPPPPVRAAVEPPAQLDRTEAEEQEEEMDTSMAEEIASGSFEEESLVESHSTSLDAGRGNDAPGRFVSHQEEHDGGGEGTSDTEDVDDKDAAADEPPAIASPPPVPTKLSALPPLPGLVGVTRTPQPESVIAGDTQKDHESDEEESVLEEEVEDDDDLDEDAAAARLRALEEKLKEMEAEDDTGVLHQLKATALEDPDERAAAPDILASKVKATKSDGENEDYEDDNYGSDFEEVEEEAEEDEIASEMSESIASVSVLSESEDVTPKSASRALETLENDTPVDSEDALNSYDYIESVERD